MSGSSRVRRASGAKIKKDKPSNKGYANANGGDVEEFDETEQCIICAEKILFAAYSPCQHITCHRCLLRQRVLYGKDLCLVCRTPNDKIVISDDRSKDFNSFSVDKLISDDKYNIYFTSEPVQEKAMGILESKCAFKDCNERFETFKDLQEHIKSAHNKFFCLICSNNKKAFVDELDLYHYKALQTHQTVGDGKGFNGHPACKHCIKKRFYSEDELNIHIRDNHERCHICDQDIPDQADYYKNYDSLYEHFKIDHYVCIVQSCLDKKFVVFRDDIDLTAHMLKEHGNLTGGNKVIIGSRNYQSQLSTFQNIPNRNRNVPGENTDSVKTKKLRLEERAKHYLEYDNEKLSAFLDVNNKYKDNKLTADELYQQYQELFKKQTMEEVTILLSEHAELYPEINSRYIKLNEVINKIKKNNSASEFPILGGRAQSPTVNLHGWGNSPSGSRNNSNDSFPVLQRPTATKKTKPVVQKPIRYTTVTTSKPKPAPVSINNFNGDTNFQPNYLESSSKSQSQSQGWGSETSSSNSSKTDISKFPPLEKKQPKKTFGRVNPVNITPASQWGASSSQPQPKVEDEWGIPVTFKKKGKGKK
ncbi:E3 ubiquitin-protein ligase Hel2p [[Candida] jaroonii]|uniref:E3 ubiquitin-protein ligase Hel2p n=1 Tax=[Candida] jaroonii TaxID=467808 RepID=A0ACA9YEB0_9ASCO|nr:E3 ubiquitin-protein ligase Hel2p [[Candida] jaroonii]